MPKPWWEDFFDADYLDLWSGMITEERTRREVQGLWQLLHLGEGSRVLDAPCGYGRLSRPLAERGARVLGVDQSQLLIDQAEHERGELPEQRLRYLRHDLRHPLSEDGFDAAINIFSSLGYGTEEDDRRDASRVKHNSVRFNTLFAHVSHYRHNPFDVVLGLNPTRRCPSWAA